MKASTLACLAWSGEFGLSHVKPAEQRCADPPPGCPSLVRNGARRPAATFCRHLRLSRRRRRSAIWAGSAGAARHIRNCTR